MESFVKKIIEWNKLELTIDTNVFSKDIILKASYNFLDVWYFFFKLDWNNIIVQLTKTDWSLEVLDDIVSGFSSSLLETYLRNKIEQDNKKIRETIVEKAINWPLDDSNFVAIDTDKKQTENQENNQVDFDKDIDEILKEIENDPDLKIDEEEIENILKEIEEESENEDPKPKIKVDTDAIKDMKKKFKK